MESPRSNRTVDAPQAPNRRSKLFVVAMCLMWLFGMTTSAGGCSNVSFLRGSHELPDTIQRLLDEADAASAEDKQGATGTKTEGTPAVSTPFAVGVARPIVRASLVREQARLTAMGEVQHRAFPIALAQVILGLLLVLAASAMLNRKAGWRSFAVQVIAANAALAIVAFVVLAPVRYAMANAVATELVFAPEAEAPPETRDAALESRRAEVAATELQLLVAQLALFGFAAYVLLRPRTVAYFASAAAAAALESDSDEP